MIAKIFPYGSAFKGVLRYNVMKPDAEPLNFKVENLKTMISAMTCVAKGNQRVKKPVLHMAISLPKDHTLSSETWMALSQDMVNELGYGNCQFAAIRHHDTDHEHVHLVINRIDPFQFKPVPNYNEKLRCRIIANKLMAKYNLPPLPLTKSPERMTHAEYKMQQRITRRKNDILKQYPDVGFQDLSIKVKTQLHELDLQCIKQSIKVRIMFAASRAKTISHLFTNLNTLGVLVQLKNGNIRYGISQKRDAPPMWMAGKKMGKNYTFSGLQQLGFSYDELPTQKVLSSQPPSLRAPLPPPGLYVCIRQQEFRPSPWQPRSHFATLNELSRSLYGFNCIVSQLNAAIKKDKQKEQEEEQEKEREEVRRGFRR